MTADGVSATATSLASGTTAVAARPDRRRIWWAVAAALLLALGLAVWADQGRTTHPAPVDPRNPGPDGAEAVARVLSDQGVQVTIARGAEELHRAAPGADSTVLVTSAGALAQSTTDRLLDDADDARVIVVQPPYVALARFASDLALFAAEVDGVVADCDLGNPVGPAVSPDGEQAAWRAPAPDGERSDLPDLARLTLRVDAAEVYRAPGCFPVADGTHVLAPVPDLAADVWLFGAAEALTNDQILRADNAAVALRLLGARDRLIWYVPDRRDAGAEEAVSLRSLLPDWILPALALSLVAGVGLLLWRGRRLGPLSVEPLPVVVRAVETTRSRGRMYRRAGDRAHAATALRTAARSRLADRLGLPTEAAGPHGTGPADAVPTGPASVTHLVATVAARTGRSEQEVSFLLDPATPPPTTDHQLVRLAQDLSRLESHVHREVSPG